MAISSQTFPSPKGEITLYTITNASGASVTLSTVGAGIISIRVPDRDGVVDDVVLGYKNPADYLYDGPCAGKIPGRYANRIANGQFTLLGKTYHLAINNGPNALHGGPEGFQNRLWKARQLTADTVEFLYHSVDGEEGYPGNLDVKAVYTWDDDCSLTLHLSAVTDAATVVNLTNHSYFNLNGESSGSILGHELRLAAPSFLPTGVSLIPTGEMDPVEDTPMDFLSFKKIGQDIEADFMPLKIAKGYDHCFVTEDYLSGKLRTVAQLKAALSGRILTVMTTQPGIQVYTGNYLAGAPESISGKAYDDYDGVALECQNFPDAPNQPQFPSADVTPEKPYDQTIIFKFSTY